MSSLVYSGISAAGTTLAGATVIPAGIGMVQVSTAAVSSTAGISLPAIFESGVEIIVRNDGLGMCLVYGATSSVAINGLAAGAPWYVAANGGIVSFISAGSNQWYVTQDIGQKTLAIPAATTALTLTNAHNAMVLAFPAMSAACAITLPAPQSNFSFQALMTGTAGFVVGFTSTGVNIDGVLQLVVAGATAAAGISFLAAGQTTVNFTATAVKGDVLQFQSTNLIYNVVGRGQAAASFTVA